MLVVPAARARTSPHGSVGSNFNTASGGRGAADTLRNNRFFGTAESGRDRKWLSYRSADSVGWRFAFQPAGNPLEENQR